MISTMPEDMRPSRRRTMLFSVCIMWMRRATHVLLPKTGAIVLPIDAVPFGEGFTRDEQDDGSNPDAEAIRASTMKLLDLVEREHIGLVIFGHDKEQWEGLKKLPEYYE